MRALTAELATALRVPERTMARRIDDAITLCTSLPATLAAMCEGRLSVQHARVVIDEVTGLADSPELVAELDARLAEAAGEVTAAKLRRRARSLREQLAPGSLAERHAAARELRHLEVEPTHDGMAWLHALLPATEAFLIHDRIDRLAREARDAEKRDADASESAAACDASSGVPPPTVRAMPAVPAARTLDQLRADVAVDLLLGRSLTKADDGCVDTTSTGTGTGTSTSTIRPTVHVTVPVMTLLGLSEVPAELDGYGPIDAETARRIAAHAPSFTRLLTHPISGTVLDVDRTSYRPPADLKRWLEVRDQTCQFPGCNRRARRSEVDHTIAYASGGTTRFDNLMHLCPFHHQLKHGSTWRVFRDAAGVLEWTSPLGRRHRTQQSPTMPQPPPPPPP